MQMAKIAEVRSQIEEVNPPSNRQHRVRRFNFFNLTSYF